MKKLLILILIALLSVLAIFIVINGLKIGSTEILGVTGIQEKNLEVDTRIQEAIRLAEKDFVRAKDEVQTSTKKLESEKKNYEEITMISNEGDVENATQLEKYELETLWVRLGNHATAEGTILKLDIAKGSDSGTDSYDLRFQATGSYISITDFISAIENDDKLGFKIEQFRLTPSSTTNNLEANFICRNISIKDVKQVSSVITEEEQNVDGTQNNTTNTNTTRTNTTGTNTNNTTGNNTAVNNTANTNVPQ